MAIESGLWGKLTTEQQTKVPKERWILLRAIDVASKCLLAEIITQTETTKAAAVLLRMMLVDKTPLAAAMGAKTPWDYGCLPHAIATDGGAAFRSDRFRQMLADLGIVFVAPQVGQPNKRATVERSFGTTRTQCLQHFTGQTFANISDKGDYDSGKNASLFVDELARALVLYDVDIYHNTPHEGLYGETPRNCWHRLMQESGCARVTPGGHQQRAIFGIQMSRKLGKRASRPRSALPVRRPRGTPRERRRDRSPRAGRSGRPRLDLGPNRSCWKTIPCATSGLEGASIHAWLGVVEDQRRRHAIAAAPSRSIIADALRQIRAIAAKAERRLSIAPHTYDADAIAREEAEMLRGFDIPEDAARNALALQAIRSPMASRSPGRTRRRGCGKHRCASAVARRIRRQTCHPRLSTGTTKTVMSGPWRRPMSEGLTNPLDHFRSVAIEGQLDRIEIMQRVRGTYFRHPKHNEVSEHVEDLIEHLLEHTDPRVECGSEEASGIAVIGESGAGKSTMLRRVFSRAPRLPRLRRHRISLPPCHGQAGGSVHTRPVRDRHPAQAWNAGARRPSSGAAVGAHGAGPNAPDGCKNLAHRRGHHITQPANSIQIKKILNTFKCLMIDDEWPIGLILSGIPELRQVLQEERQVARRLAFVPLAGLTIATDARKVGKIVQQLAGVARLGISAVHADALAPRIITRAAISWDAPLSGSTKRSASGSSGICVVFRRTRLRLPR